MLAATELIAVASKLTGQPVSIADGHCSKLPKSEQSLYPFENSVADGFWVVLHQR